MNNYKIMMVDEECVRAIRDIKNIVENKGVNISLREASRILGKSYFQIKFTKKPAVIWNDQPSLR